MLSRFFIKLLTDLEPGADQDQDHGDGHPPPPQGGAPPDEDQDQAHASPAQDKTGTSGAGRVARCHFYEILFCVIFADFFL